MVVVVVRCQLKKKIDYCMNKFYPDFKKEDREVEILGNKCVPKIIKLSAPISNKLVSSLNINQNINGEIKKVNDYRLDFPYRLLLSWERPNLNNTGRGIEAAPSQYNIYRKINKKWELIKKIKVEDIKQTTFKWVDGDNKTFQKKNFLINYKQVLFIIIRLPQLIQQVKENHY